MCEKQMFPNKHRYLTLHKNNYKITFSLQIQTMI